MSNQNQHHPAQGRAGFCYFDWSVIPNANQELQEFIDFGHDHLGETILYAHFPDTKVSKGMALDLEHYGDGPKTIKPLQQHFDWEVHDILDELAEDRKRKSQLRFPPGPEQESHQQETLGQTTRDIRDKAQAPIEAPTHRRQYPKGLNYFMQRHFLSDIKSGALCGKRKDAHESRYQVLNYIHTHMGHRDQRRLWPAGWYSHCTVEDIALATENSYRTVQYCLSDLRRMGYIRTIWRGRPQNKIPATLYLVTTRPEELIAFQNQNPSDHPNK